MNNAQLSSISLLGAFRVPGTDGAVSAESAEAAAAEILGTTASKLLAIESKDPVSGGRIWTFRFVSDKSACRRRAKHIDEVLKNPTMEIVHAVTHMFYKNLAVSRENTDLLDMAMMMPGAEIGSLKAMHEYMQDGLSKHLGEAQIESIHALCMKEA